MWRIYSNPDPRGIVMKNFCKELDNTKSTESEAGLDSNTGIHPHETGPDMEPSGEKRGRPRNRWRGARRGDTIAEIKIVGDDLKRCR
jgi:hypothetical protein